MRFGDFGPSRTQPPRVGEGQSQRQLAMKSASVKPAGISLKK